MYCIVKHVHNKQVYYQFMVITHTFTLRQRFLLDVCNMCIMYYNIT